MLSDKWKARVLAVFSLGLSTLVAFDVIRLWYLGIKWQRGATMIELWNESGTPFTIVLVGVTAFLSLIFLCFLTKPTKEDKQRDVALQAIINSLSTQNESHRNMEQSINELKNTIESKFTELTSSMNSLVNELRADREERHKKRSG